MRHGNEMDESKCVYISIRVKGNFLVLDVSDEGKGFDCSRVGDPRSPENVRKEKGRGLFLMRHFADRVEFLKGGSRVRIKYRLTNEC
jgi:serine/threonine-protein kinase RsbW